MGPAILAAIGAAAPGTLAAIGTGIGSLFSKAARDRRRLHKKDLADLKAGRLGFTGGKKARMVEQAAQNIRAETSGVGDEIARSVAAGGTGRSGYGQKAWANLARARGDAIARARGQVDELSEKHAQVREAAIRGETTALAQQQQARGSQIAGAALGAVGAGAAAGLKGYSREKQLTGALDALHSKRDASGNIITAGSETEAGQKAKAEALLAAYAAEAAAR